MGREVTPERIRLAQPARRRWGLSGGPGYPLLWGALCRLALLFPMGQARAVTESGLERAMWALNNPTDPDALSNPLLATGPASYDGSRAIAISTRTRRCRRRSTGFSSPDLPRRPRTARGEIKVSSHTDIDCRADTREPKDRTWSAGNASIGARRPGGYLPTRSLVRIPPAQRV